MCAATLRKIEQRSCNRRCRATPIYSERMASGEDEPLSRLTGEVLEKAKLELKEDPNRREEFIRELRNKIEEVESKINQSVYTCIEFVIVV